ncbi:MAG: hypothetical protein LCI00_23225 [Chloroflexi bacterium]|nr:hypothetical protein [Chloroflexota bacterium]MCC6895966.1 hypothetical protein [Anaerolineae bacterium]
MTDIDHLLRDIFSGSKPFFYSTFERWVRGSRRYRIFATSYSSKIRSKLKSARDDSGLKDLWAELETAALLLTEPRFTLEYELYTALKQRGPDFTVTFKTHTPFNVEVRRFRTSELAQDNSEARVGKLMGIFCDKVGQMPPSVMNLLWLTAERDIPEADLNQAALNLRQIAERKNEDFFMRRGFKSATEFLRQYQQVSGVVLRQPDETVVWLNPLARHKPLPEMVNALRQIP